MAKNCDTGICGHGVSTQVIQLMLTRCGDTPVELLDPSNLLFFFPIALLSTPSSYSTQQTETMVKRKHESNGTDANVPVKKTTRSQAEVHANFGDKLFDKHVVTKYREDYAQSGPYVAPDICLYSQI